MRRYYAHPQNAFWKLIAGIFECDGELAYARGIQLLTRNRIALWDVLAAAERPGSLDSAIVHDSAVANDFAGFFRAHPRIRRVFFNGRKAEEICRCRVLPDLTPEHSDIRYECLPSSSPAHAGMRFAEKLERWRKIKERQK